VRKADNLPPSCAVVTKSGKQLPGTLCPILTSVDGISAQYPVSTSNAFVFRSEDTFLPMIN